MFKPTFLVVTALTALLALIPATASARRTEATLCVGNAPGCFSTIQTAVDAAHNGDTIELDRGTFAGGVAINVSVKIVGSGAASTVIRGGAHVLTIGEFGAPSEPTVSISGVTITGGMATSSPESVPFADAEDVLALGGGIEVPPAGDLNPGATVTISNSVIRGNRAAPTATVPLETPFALAAGGGIDNWGKMTLTDTAVMDNQAGSPANVASDVESGGIANWFTGSLRLERSTVSGNRSNAGAPNGHFAENGGIWSRGTLTIDGSRVSNNSAHMSAAAPNGFEAIATTGGVGVVDGSSATIRDSLITDNTVTATNRIGDAVAIAGGVGVGGGVSLVLRDSTIGNNRVTASVPNGSAANASADSGGLGISDSALVTVANVRLTGNIVDATAPAGTASALSGAIGTGTTRLTTISDSLVSNNTLTAKTTNGSAVIQGAGIWNIGLLALRDTTVRDNKGAAGGSDGIAQGGGIWNASVPDGPQTQHELTLIDSSVTNNALTAAEGVTRQGGGVFTAFPLTVKDSVIAKNSPDQCYGC
jgi:hypothetical protein